MKKNVPDDETMNLPLPAPINEIEVQFTFPVEANARLIAGAAPELFFALKEIVQETGIDDYDSLLLKAPAGLLI